MKLGHVHGCCKGSEPHPECNAEMCMRCVVCVEHQIFCAAAGRRKANGIKLRRLSLMAEQSQLEGFHLLWETWLERWGKTRAMDAVIVSMAHYEASYQDLRELVKEQKRKRRTA